MVTNPEWMDPLVTGRNRVLTHAPLGAYPDAESARQRASSPYVRSLNGTWQFQLTSSPDHEPEEASGWIDMPVPSNWQLDERIDDHPIYTNMYYPFDSLGESGHVPPLLPDINPTGWYRTTFDVPTDWDGRAIFLLFESCDSACRVWVNGSDVGYSQDSKLPHEFDVTPFVKAGGNSLSVMVPRYCDGFWLECQDYWHLSGIQRDVTLYSKPRAHIRDFVVQTTLDDRFSDAELSVRVYMNKDTKLTEGYSVEFQLHDTDGSDVLDEHPRVAVSTGTAVHAGGNPNRGAACFKVPIAAPRKWTAETPYLYTLVMVLRDGQDKAVDFESCRVGFRQCEIRDGILIVNGRRLLVRGVNDHEHHPDRGRALTVEDMRAELVAMKRLNFNAVRTSHYPHHPTFYDLCDELGMYVVDEANLETHGIGALLSRDPLWMNAYMERAQRMALRDRNHPCIIAWSLGNESYYGPHHAGMAAWLRQVDPTRPVQYESGFPPAAISDIMVPMYPKLDWVREVLSNSAESRPLIMCEYAYTKGNALGNFAKYWELVDELPRFQGGFIWDWRDKALVRTIEGEKQWAYGNEFDGGIGPDGHNYGERENPQMCINGVVNPDLTPKPGAWEVKKVQAPLAFRAEAGKALQSGKVTVWNKYLALDLVHLEIAWELTADGVVRQQGVVPTPEIEAGERGVLEIPFVLPEPGEGVEYWLNLRARQRETTPWSDAGHVVAWEQFELTEPCSENRAQRARHEEEDSPTTLRLVRDNGTIQIKGRTFAFVFDAELGAITGWRIDGRDLLTRPLEHSFMRARTDNDYIIGHKGSYCRAWQETGLDRLQTVVVECVVSEGQDGSVSVRCTTRHQADGHDESILVTTTYRVSPNGRLDVQNDIDASAVPVPTLPRIGMRMGIAQDFSKLTWYGRGPHESYIDRKSSALVGVYESSVDDQFFPFVDPCECGGHEDTRWVHLQDGEGEGLQVSGCPLFHFSALHYTIEDLLRASHVYELDRTDDIQLSIDGFHMGLGGDTGWTPNVHPEYLLPPAVYQYAFAIEPTRRIA